MDNTKKKKYPDLPSVEWTIVTEDSPDGREFYGLNVNTGVETKRFTSYAKAIDAIHAGPYAEPWGV
jgi:hypothetical protein